jgi:hypothetical protein
LPEPVGPRKQKVAHGTARGVQSGKKHLIDFRDLFDRRVLADNLAAQGALKVTGIIATAAGIEHGC